MGWMSITHQALLRLLVSIGLLVSLLGIGSYWVYSAAVEKSARERSDDLAYFYQARLAQLEREWELQAQDFKVRVEVSRLLENPRTAITQMQAFMTVQGTNRRFQHLLIENRLGDTIFAFGNALQRADIPLAAMRTDSNTGSDWHTANGDLYRVLVVPLWLGAQGTGYMAVFFKVDNALLFNMAAPDITLWVTHRGRIKASSAGHDSVDDLNRRAHTTDAPANTGERAIPWSGDNANQTALHIHAPLKTLFSRTELVVAATVIPLVDGLILWFTLGFWLMRNSRRVSALGGAVSAFSADQRPSQHFSHALSAAHGTQEDEITVVADALNEMARQAEQREQERSLEAAQRHLWSQVFASSLDAIMITDNQNQILSVNQAFTELTGYASGEVLGRDPRLLSSGRETRAFYTTMWRDLTLKGQWSGEVEDRRKDGTTYPKWLNISIVRNPVGEIVNYVGVFKDITAQKQSEERFIYLANHDTLTKLPNRHLLLDRLRKAIELANRTQQAVALLFLDLDNFKWVNDSLGHASGDKLLMAVADRLSITVRSSDTVARLGGDEFVVLLLYPLGNQDIVQVAEKIIAHVAHPLDLGGHDFHITTSIGISVYPNDGEDPAALLKHADTAMYAAKAAGKNQYRFFDAVMNQMTLERIELEHDLRLAIKNDEFIAYYQPKLCLKTNTICGSEALIRWRHPERGLVPPDKFIPLAEETALIIEIGEWMMRSVCQQVAAWQAAGLKPRSVAINLSAIQLESDTFADTVEEIFRASGIDAGLIEFELTESAVLRNPDRSVATLNRLRQLGVRLALDDFGTGYSSLSYLKRLPVDTLKIDRSFIMGIPDDPDSAQIVRMIVGLAKTVHMEVVAEGIETAAQRDFLQEIGCDFLQGYLIARPMPAADLTQRLSQPACDACGLAVRCELTATTIAMTSKTP